MKRLGELVDSEAPIEKPKDEKPWTIFIFTKTFTSSLTFKGKERALKNYEGIIQACANANDTNAQLININDDVGGRLSFMTNFVVGLKMEYTEDCKGKNLRDLQIKHIKLLISELEGRSESWKGGYADGDQL